MDSNVVHIGQSFTIENAGELLEKYKDAADKKDSIKIVSDEIDVIDLTGIQFLYSLKKEAERGIKTDIKLKFTPAAKELILKCGFKSIL